MQEQPADPRWHQGTAGCHWRLPDIPSPGPARWQRRGGDLVLKVQQSKEQKLEWGVHSSPLPSLGSSLLI